ncbi:hypothetical protein BKA82DRAFT_4010531 [Pisolithus tinctorius]|nr:hypothetical protein BKA82DRAFT_4010531 [Pisolithus tinctorius]
MTAITQISMPFASIDDNVNATCLSALSWMLLPACVIDADKATSQCLLVHMRLPSCAYADCSCFHARVGAPPFLVHLASQQFGTGGFIHTSFAGYWGMASAMYCLLKVVVFIAKLCLQVFVCSSLIWGTV